EIGMDQLLFDQLPDDASHLVAVELDDRVLDLDLRHGGKSLCVFGRAPDGCGTRGLGGAAIAPPGEWRKREAFVCGQCRANPLHRPRLCSRKRHAMPGAGTDRTKTAPALAGPIVVLVEPQLGENIGTTARAMANFGLTR